MLRYQHNMVEKVREKEKAIALRKQGLSYRDILKHVPVSKSSLSLWLKDLPLTDEEKSSLRYRKSSNMAHGRIKAAVVLHNRRLERDKAVFAEAEKEFQTFVTDPFFSVGISLYWAEGAKRANAGVTFSNSDPDMVRVMVNWIERYLSVSRKDLSAILYTHRPFEHDGLEEFWSKTIGIPIENFGKTVYKPTGLLVKKRQNYKGCLRIRVRKSTVNFRKMLFWQNLLIKHLADSW